MNLELNLKAKPLPPKAKGRPLPPPSWSAPQVLKAKPQPPAQIIKKGYEMEPNPSFLSEADLRLWVENNIPDGIISRIYKVEAYRCKVII